MLKATVLYAWHGGSFRVQHLGLLPVIVIEFETAVYRIAEVLVLYPVICETVVIFVTHLVIHTFTALGVNRSDLSGAGS